MEKNYRLKLLLQMSGGTPVDNIAIQEHSLTYIVKVGIIHSNTKS